MNSFYKSFLVDSPLGTSATNRSVVFAFGKHPGWDDHIQDIGIVNDSIALAKRILYVNGIGKIIDAGDWENVESEKIVTDFNHAFVWLRKDEFLIGRLWSSTDGKGRSKYPMIIGCHLKNVSFGFAFQKIFPHLVTLQAKCKSFSKQGEVFAAVEQTQSSICQVLNAKDKAIYENQKNTNELQSKKSLLPKIDEIEQAEEGWARVFYQIKSQLENYGYRSFQQKHFINKALSAEVLRLPLVDLSFEKTVESWLCFLQRQISTDVPLLFFTSEDMPWCDIIVGEPSRRELFNLKSSLKAFPYPYQIPYLINDEFKIKVQAVKRGLVERKSATETYIFGDLRNFDKWIQYLFITGGLLIIIAITFYLIT